MMLIRMLVAYAIRLSLVVSVIFGVSQTVASPSIASEAIANEVAANQVAANQETGNETGILWRIEKAGVAPSFLLGTAHVSDPRITNFKQELNQVLGSVDSISLEIDLDPANQMRMAGMMMVPGGRLEDQVGQAYFEKLMVEMNTLQVPAEMVQMFKPWAAALAISLPANHNASQAMDVLIYQFAHANGKAFHALETIEEQIGVFENLTPAQQIIFLQLTIDSLALRDTLYEKVLDAYLASDLGLLMMINEESMIMAPPDFVEPLMYALVDLRNLGMLQRMQPRLAEGNALVAVGALHLPGEQGLLALLRGQGFKVSAIY